MVEQFNSNCKTKCFFLDLKNNRKQIVMEVIMLFKISFVPKNQIDFLFLMI